MNDLNETEQELYSHYDKLSNAELREDYKAAIHMLNATEDTPNSALAKHSRLHLCIIAKVWRDGGMTTSEIL